MNAVQDQIQAKSGNVVTYQQPSYGKFSTRLSTNYWFGLPRSVGFAGLVMDVDRLATSITAKDNTATERLNFMAASGNRASAMEHLVPEQMFSTEEAPAFGVSAVKALALAGAAGQKIWTIEQDNVGIALAAINHSSEIESEIRNAVRVGKVATIHEAPVAYQGSTFVGYTIIDSVTGAGAYKIGGGENGGYLSWAIGFSGGAIAMALVALMGAATASALFFPAIAIAFFTAFYLTTIIIALSTGANMNFGCLITGAIWGLSTITGPLVFLLSKYLATRFVTLIGALSAGSSFTPLPSSLDCVTEEV